MSTPAPNAMPPRGTSLEYQRTRYIRARRHVVGGLTLMGGAITLIFLVLSLVIAANLFHGGSPGTGFLVTAAIMLMVFATGVTNLTCAFLIRMGKRPAIHVAIAVTALQALGVLFLFALAMVQAFIVEFEPLMGIVLGGLSLLILTGFVAILVELGIVLRHGGSAVLE